MFKKIIGGVVTLVIGGTVYTVSKADITNNFSANTGLNQQQAEEYVNNIKQSDLTSFSKVGDEFINDGNSLQSQTIDCVNYTYKWVNPSLSCENGKLQVQKLSSDEITLGNCYKTLDSNLGNSAKSKMNECIQDIDNLNSDFNLPIVTSLISSSTIENSRKINAYNKSILQAALSK